MKRANLGAIVRYEGRIAEVVAVGEGRTLTLSFLDERRCPACGRCDDVHLLEHAPLFQDRVEPVETVTP